MLAFIEQEKKSSIPPIIMKCCHLLVIKQNTLLVNSLPTSLSTPQAYICLFYSLESRLSDIRILPLIVSSPDEIPTKHVHIGYTCNCRKEMVIRNDSCSLQTLQVPYFFLFSSLLDILFHRSYFLRTLGILLSQQTVVLLVIYLFW